MNRGFTLIEVLIAAAITAVLAVTVLAAAGGLARTMKSREGEARRDERRSRAIEVLAHDWRGRLRILKGAERPPMGTSAVEFSTTADALNGDRRSSQGVRYVASERGLRREEGTNGIDLVDEPVVLEAWDGEQWRAEPKGRVLALRLTFVAPGEAVVLR